MNCSLLEDENYVNEIALKVPVWIAECEKDLIDNRSIWEWLKYNIRAHAIQYSIKRAQERTEKEDSLQTEYSSTKYFLNLEKKILLKNVCEN